MHPFSLQKQGSHKWTLSAAQGKGPWVSADGVKVDLYNISPSMFGQSGTNIGRIGTISHELGHFMGAPDMYDTNGGEQSGHCFQFILENDQSFPTTHSSVMQGEVE